ncbi:MAG: porin family protein [Alphaproteobacteria bacterium]|nr:porin family protein [Alphaproteobacteria bacterium]
MKKVLLATFAITAFVATSAEAGVKVRPYVSAKAGYVWADARAYVSDADTGEKISKLMGTNHTLMGAFAAGVKVCAFRTELEYNHWGKTKSDRVLPAWNERAVSTLEQQSLMLNGYFDIPTKTALRPYVGAGIGMARIRGRVLYPETVGKHVHRDTSFAWQAGAGFGYDLTKNLTLDVGYRYVNNGNVVIKSDFGFPIKYKARDQEILVGLRYAF